jgi:O-antigen chain-terminating methyltransferase
LDQLNLALHQAIAEQQAAKDQLNQDVAAVRANLDQLNNIGTDIPAVFTTRGQIDSDSYLSLALQSSNSSLEELRSINKDEDIFYFLLENLFRGSIEDVRGRQSIYLPYILDAQTNTKGHFFLDLGCGRGEFLSLLQEHNIPAKGVDKSVLMQKLLQKQGFDFIRSDALPYLQGLGNNLLMGLSMFQVIEHLDFNYVNNIMKAAYQKISKGGIIILESVNPLCPLAMGNFYLDPTHASLFSSDMVKLMLEWHGFSNVRIIFSSLLPEHIRFTEVAMNYLDYAVIGKKT